MPSHLADPTDCDVDVLSICIYMPGLILVEGP